MHSARCSAAFSLLLLGWSSSAFAVPIGSGLTLTPLLDLRWRQEVVDTLAKPPTPTTSDHAYSHGHLRERFGGDLTYQVLTLHVLAQSANSYNVPDNASYGPGKNYFTYSNSNSAPSQIAAAELSLIARPTPAASITVGRQAIKEGAEPASGNARLDWIEENRVSERLIGTWDWTNVGRRFDGASGAYNTPRWNTTGFAARILQGGFDYTDAFTPLDSVRTAGLSIAARPGTLIPQTEVRFFDIGYRDDRPVIRTSLGDRLYLNTVGADLIGVYSSGPGILDALVWGAYQSGDYGTKNQSAEAFLLEGGYGLSQAVWSPWVRVGMDYASGGSPTDSRTHTTFFNLAPTNHKFYGIQDLNAFQNLTDYFIQVMAQPKPSIKLVVEEHLFRLSNTRDGWYAGSGPASHSILGYTDNLPVMGELSNQVGNEIDLVGTWTPIKQVSLQSGYSHFEGGAAARVLFPSKSDTNFFYFQTTLKY